MTQSDSYFIIPRLPKEFPCKDNRIGECGMFTLKAVIEGYNGKRVNDHKYYASGLISRSTGYMFPRNLKKVLNKHGLQSEYITSRWAGKKNKLNFLKEKIKEGPLILLIGHAYNSKKNFNIRRGVKLQHYITLRGYDDGKKVFFVYDSNTVKNNYKDELPAGNIVLSYNLLLRCWRLGCRGLYRNFGIAVDYNLER